MKKYIVTQCCRYVGLPEETESNKNKMRKFTFSKDLNVGTYIEKDFLALVDKDFINSGKFKEYCELGWIKVVEERDVTSKTLNQFSNKL